VPFYAPRTRRRAPAIREEALMAIAIDPVCGMEVDTVTATLTSEYEGTVYYFCGKGCKLDFEDEPETYLDPEYKPQGM
jgi:Cu+-exporting ATPase